MFFVTKKKISGMIQESITNKFNKNYFIIGLGINFLSSPNIKNYKTTHIFKYIKDISLEQYFEIFINYFLYYFNQYFISNNIDFIDKYNNSQMFLNQYIKITVNKKTFSYL